MVSFSLRQRIFLPPPLGPHSGVLSFESIRTSTQECKMRFKPEALSCILYLRPGKIPH